VLYIEDNEVNRLLMQGMLGQRPGIELELAALPEEGLAMAHAAPPALVLLDIQLPGIDGFVVLARRRADALTAGIPVIAVSANAMPADRARAQAAGFDEYVTKPIDLDSLLAAVDRWLDGRPRG
jgi:CheY-like chemotaxis protein